MIFSETHRARLASLLADVDRQLAPLHPPQAACGSCGRCCSGPPLYMTLTDLEYSWLLDDPEYAARQRALRVDFVPLSSQAPDRRHGFRHYTCPFYETGAGCTVYRRRPLACRVFGPMSRMPIEWDFCSYQYSARLYEDAHDIPNFGAYLALVAEADARRGYLLRQPVRYQRPIMELLTEEPPALGDAWEERIRLRLPALESEHYTSESGVMPPRPSSPASPEAPQDGVEPPPT